MTSGIVYPLDFHEQFLLAHSLLSSLKPLLSASDSSSGYSSRTLFWPAFQFFWEIIMKIKTLLAALGTAAALLPTLAVSAPVVYNLALPDISTFDSVITGTGASVQVVKVVSGSAVYNYTDSNGNNQTLTVTRSGGSTATASSGYSSGGQSLSGAVYDISPNSGGAIPGQNSGLHFLFSGAVNAFGFEIGDWATCCTTGTRPAAVQATYGVPATGSGLWISFNGGAATLPANALSANDNPGYVHKTNGQQDYSYTNFIGAIDSSSTFTSLDFWGDGFGEYLVAGGSFRFASVPIGSVGNDVPEPESLALFGMALAALAMARRRRSL